MGKFSRKSGETIDYLAHHSQSSCRVPCSCRYSRQLKGADHLSQTAASLVVPIVKKRPGHLRCCRDPRHRNSSQDEGGLGTCTKEAWVSNLLDNLNNQNKKREIK